MKNIFKISKFFFPLVFLFPNSDMIDSYIVSKEYAVTIHGTSNLHSWNENVETVTGRSTISWNSDESFNLESLKIEMEVRSIKSGEGAIMNNNTYKALRGDANPQIIFNLSEPVKSIELKSNESVIRAKGSLTIAGVSRIIYLNVKVAAQSREGFTFEGKQTVKMTDYAVDPPTALFGTLKTGDEITIDFKTGFIRITNYY